MLRQHAWKLGAGALCAASGFALHSWSSPGDDGYARCYEQPAQHAPSAAAAAAAAAKSAAELAALAEWLRQQGADIDAIEIKESDTDGGRYGVYATDAIRQRGAARGWWGRVAGWAGAGRSMPVTIAAFTLSGTLTAANLARHPQQGPVLQELLDLGVADERSAVILHLAVERQRTRHGGAGGGGGGAQPWLDLLPASFTTTLFFSELDMQWLRGTTLYKATRLRHKSLRETWSRLQPVAKQLCEQAGLPGAPTLEDWVWANSIFWSRAIAFPSPAPNGSGGVVMQEGIVPGLDFCNHDASSSCKWTVYGAEAEAAAGRRARRQQGSEQAVPAAVSLVCPCRHLPPPGSEVTINYGDKSNEELLFLYGFAVENNPAEVLTLMCPLPPPAEWDELLQARLLLLQRRGLQPRLHLPAADLAPCAGAAGAGGGKQHRGTKQGSSGSGKVLAADLPEGVLETLEVFVMDPAQVQQALQASEAEAASAGSSTGSSGSSSTANEVEQSGMRMALLTTLVRLLELKALEMEGQEEGTGLLEQDEQLLAAAGPGLPRNQRHALLYRIGQKRLARDYLVHAKQLLQQEMANLARLQGMVAR